MNEQIVNAWLDKVIAGDQEAFEVVSLMTRQKIYGTVATMVRNKEDVHDIVGEIYYQLWRALPSYDRKQVENPTYQEPGLEGHSVLNFIGTSKEDNLPFYLTDVSGKEIDTGIADHDQPEGILAFVTDGSALPQSITLNVDVNRIGKTKGSWKGQVVIDQSKAKEATKTAN